MAAKVLVWNKGLTKEEWLSWRRTGIGGSDAPAVYGISRWKTAVEVYLEKLGDVQPAEETEQMRMGKTLKDIIARQFCEETGKKIRKRNAILQHPEHSFMIANIDRWIIGEQSGLMCRTTHEFGKDEWEDDKVPTYYKIQCQHYMAVTGAKSWWIAVLIGGNKLKCIQLERDEPTIQHLIEVEQHFWTNHVLTKTPPEYDGSPAAGKLLDRLYPESDQKIIDLPQEADALVKQFIQAEQEEKSARSRKLSAENKLKALLGNNETGRHGNYKVNWKSVSRRKNTLAPVTYRRFTIKPD